MNKIDVLSQAKWRKGLFLILFACILLGGFSGLLKPNQVTQENRQLAELPQISDGIRLFPDQFQAYTDDHFGMRSTLVSLGNKINLKLFNQSSNDQVWIGKDGWLFLRDPILEADLKSNAKFTDNELIQWREYLEAHNTWLMKQGISYIFVVVPNKHTIYPEYLPKSVQVKGKSRLVQLEEYISAHSNVHFINLTNTLRSAKGIEPLYYKLDTHWTDTAAFSGYLELMQTISQIFPKLEPLTTDDIEGVRTHSRLAVLARFMALEGYFPKEKRTELRVIVPQSELVRTEQSTAQDEILIYRRADDSLPSLLVYRDSFADAMIPFLAERFHTSTFIRKPKQRDIKPSDIEKFKPDIVIEQVVENKLLTLPVPNIGQWIH